MEAVLDKFGRVVIPKQIRDDLGVHAGSVLRIEEVGNEIHITPVQAESHVMLKEGVLVYTGKSVGDVDHAVEIHRKERLRKGSSMQGPYEK